MLTVSWGEGGRACNGDGIVMLTVRVFRLT